MEVYRTMNKKNNGNYCNNCGKTGHMFHNCKTPITSAGVIAFRRNNGIYEYLMIRRKQTLGYIDFIRGKYQLNDREFIINMFEQMTNFEKTSIIEVEFDELWKNIWGDEGYNNKYKMEETTSKYKFNVLKRGLGLDYTLKDLVRDSQCEWLEPEWGFPKGRRNYQEKDYECAVREFCEETGYNKQMIEPIINAMPYDEIFTGSNYKSYKHKYFLMYMKPSETKETNSYQKSEVSKMEWMSLDKCLSNIRSYNLEKKNIIKNVDICLKNLTLYRL
jgi:8-oxo-dGTP pyrophosphatase MutT (NUDIX family)